MPPSVTIRLYAQARQAVGRDRLSVRLDPGGEPLEAVLQELARDHPALRALLPHCRFVREGEYLPRSQVRIAPGDEIGVHPPYSGG